MNPPVNHAPFVVSAEDSGVRLDRFLADRLPDMSRTRIQLLVDRGQVLLDGLVRKSSHRIESGQTVTVEISSAPPAGVRAEAIPLDVLYADGDIAVINKPAGIVVHPGAGAQHGTLVSALLHHFGGAGGLSDVGGPLRLGIVHRLDKGTSGALLIARTNAAHRKLVAEFSDRRVRKTYLALLHGKWKEALAGSIDLPVARDLRRRTRMTARRREGRTARTDWRALVRLPAFTLVEANLHTGRTHQIRVHFSALGCPVVGDTLYGAPARERSAQILLPPLGRNFLHAARIGFEHPRTREQMIVRAPLSPELVKYWKALGSAAEADATRIDLALKEFL